MNGEKELKAISRNGNLGQSLSAAGRMAVGGLLAALVGLPDAADRYRVTVNCPADLQGFAFDMEPERDPDAPFDTLAKREEEKTWLEGTAEDGSRLWQVLDYFRIRKEGWKGYGSEFLFAELDYQGGKVADVILRESGASFFLYREGESWEFHRIPQTVRQNPFRRYRQEFQKEWLSRFTTESQRDTVKLTTLLDGVIHQVGTQSKTLAGSCTLTAVREKSMSSGLPETGMGPSRRAEPGLRIGSRPEGLLVRLGPASLPEGARLVAYGPGGRRVTEWAGKDLRNGSNGFTWRPSSGPGLYVFHLEGPDFASRRVGLWAP